MTISEITCPPPSPRKMEVNMEAVRIIHIIIEVVFMVE
jgi:hypothetical protein